MLTCKFEDGNEASLRHVTVDVLLFNQEEKLLLVKRTGKLLEGGKWGLVGGFVDRDESLSEAAVREAMEESGYVVESLKLLTIRDNPDRPKEDRQNISFVFIGLAGNKNGDSDWEVDDQKWFDLNNLPPETEIAFDHFQNIELYKKYIEKKVNLPVLNI
jgi:ADP-ribose pyrophosphatase YjhB (NUDIX family)